MKKQTKEENKLIGIPALEKMKQILIENKDVGKVTRGEIEDIDRSIGLINFGENQGYSQAKKDILKEIDKWLIKHNFNYHTKEWNELKTKIKEQEK